MQLEDSADLCQERGDWRDVCGVLSFSFSALRAVAREVEIYQPEKPARRMKPPEAQ